MGTTTAGLPLRPGEHYERCPGAGCGTVYRTKRRTRFRCPKCHRLAYAIPTAKGEPGRRRVLEDGDDGAVYRILDRRPDDGETPPTFGDDAVLYIEGGEPPVIEGDPSDPPGPPTSRKPRREPPPAVPRERATGGMGGLVGRIWRGSLGDLRGPRG